MILFKSDSVNLTILDIILTLLINTPIFLYKPKKMKLLKFTTKVLISFIFGFGFWYSIGVLLSSEFNPLAWSIFGKIMYIIFAWGTSRTTHEVIENY
jgi:hypothetical protein